MKRLLALFLALTLFLPVLALGEGDINLEDELVEDVDLDDENAEYLEDGVFEDESLAGSSGTIELTDEMADELRKSVEASDTNTTTVNTDSLYINPNLPDNVINILLLGVDTREDTLGENDNTVKRADVQLILSYNRDDGSVKLTSIRRDTLVKNPSTGKNIPITNAYRSFDDAGTFHDNPQGSIAIVNYNFELNIQYFFTINFYGVAKIIEALGGVDVDLTKAEAWSINTYLSTKRIYVTNSKGEKRQVSHGNKIKQTYGKEFGLPEPLEVKDGVQHLTGLQALIYARLRETVRQKYPLGGDWERTKRTRNLMNLLLKKALQLDVLDMIDLAGEAVEYMFTNMNAAEMTDLILSVLRGGIMDKLKTADASDGFLFDQFRIPMDKTWSYSEGDVFMSRTNGNFQKNVETLHEFIYGRYYPANP